MEWTSLPQNSRPAIESRTLNGQTHSNVRSSEATLKLCVHQRCGDGSVKVSQSNFVMVVACWHSRSEITCWTESQQKGLCMDQRRYMQLKIHKLTIKSTSQITDIRTCQKNKSTLAKLLRIAWWTMVVNKNPGLRYLLWIWILQLQVFAFQVYTGVHNWLSDVPVRVTWLRGCSQPKLVKTPSFGIDFSNKKTLELR